MLEPFVNTYAGGDQSAHDQFRLLAQILTGQLLLPELQVEPPKPRYGRVALADGTNWDPLDVGEPRIVWYNGTSWVALFGAPAPPVFIAPTLLNSWVNAMSVSYEVPGYYKDILGRVHMRGAIRTGVLGTVAFILPEGYRPTANVYLQTIAHNGASYVHAYLVVEPDGEVRPSFGANNEFQLNGLSFAAV